MCESAGVYVCVCVWESERRVEGVAREREREKARAHAGTQENGAGGVEWSGVQSGESGGGVCV